MGLFEERSPSSMNGAAFVHDGVSIIDEFVDFYEQYSYASGVIDPNVDLAATGHVRRVAGSSFDWADTSVELIHETLASGDLINNDVMKFITSGVGQEWANPNAYEFQIPPGSGGRVYIFEKESGIFNCVQEIKPLSVRESLKFGGRGTYHSGGDVTDPSNTAASNEEWLGPYRDEYNDRFGHSVGISQNSQVVSIGSPFTNTPCEIFERDNSENERMYKNLRDWLVFTSMTAEVNRYDDLLAASGKSVAQNVVYHELSQSNKFSFRVIFT